jgi:hypothetical protein
MTTQDDSAPTAAPAPGIEVWTTDGCCKVCGIPEDPEARHYDHPDRPDGHEPGCPVGMLAAAAVVVPTGTVYHDQDRYRKVRPDDRSEVDPGMALEHGRSIGRHAARQHAEVEMNRRKGWGASGDGLVEVEWDEAHLRMPMPAGVLAEIRRGYDETWGRRHEVLRHAERVVAAEAGLDGLIWKLEGLRMDLDRLRPDLNEAGIATRVAAIEAVRRDIVADTRKLAELKQTAP